MTLDLQRVLVATGYLTDGQPAPGLHLGDAARRLRRRQHDFSPDASWRSPAAFTVYFKFEKANPPIEVVSRWRQEIWNEGFAPLLWVVTPQRIDVYNAFSAPESLNDAANHLLKSFTALEASLRQLDHLAGRMAMETGQFWLLAPSVNRKTSVDHRLLSDLGALERQLVSDELERGKAQALIGRTIFTQYLIDRGIVPGAKLKRECGHETLPAILRDRQATRDLFTWLSTVFNGDMFPSSAVQQLPAGEYLGQVADFLDGTNLETGQQSFFPYQFDVIPVELISSIYEQFAHAEPPPRSGKPKRAEREGVHYTRLPLVSLVLDEVMAGLKGSERVIDLTCGSGVFLVEALRRLVWLKMRGEDPTREVIRSTLYNQIYGVDISESAVSVAAFSLYLAALELDPNPKPPHALAFKPLIGRTLLVGNAHTIDERDEGRNALRTADGARLIFDVIVGNPPWSFKGERGTQARRKLGDGRKQPRGEGLDFVHRALDFADPNTRFGLVLSAIPFFSRSDTGIAAALETLEALKPVTIVNLASLQGWLFETASMPAVVLFARHRKAASSDLTMVRVPWSESGAQSRTFEISPSDILGLNLEEIARHPIKLKAAAIGHRRDLVLLEALTARYGTLGSELAVLNSELCVGLTRGSEDSDGQSDASHLLGLEFLDASSLTRFHVPSGLPIFNRKRAERPRSRGTYSAPLLVVKEMLNEGPRVVAAAADRDVVFTNACYGASLPGKDAAVAHLLAAVLSSSLASWFFIMCASEFGIWKRRLLKEDIALLPVPPLSAVVETEAGRQLLAAVNQLETRGVLDAVDFTALDDAVLDLYEVTGSDRLIVASGLARAGCEWKEGRTWYTAPAGIADLLAYGAAFNGVIGAWLSARNERRIRAEVIALPHWEALRVVRFVLEDKLRSQQKADVEVIETDTDLRRVLRQIGDRLNVQVATALAGKRELRIHGRDEVWIVKPAARQHWLGINAIEDADSVVAESLRGAPL